MTTTRCLAVAATLAAGLAHGQAPTKRDLSQGNTLYLVPYAHLDTQWRWSYPQVIREFIWNTMADNLALIDKYPTYVFNFSGSRRYEMMKEYYPDEYQKVVAAVKAGRWFPCGSSVDENDANVPSAESTIRHVLYGNEWFRKNLGVASEEYMLPDCFGFPYALPTILNYCGIKGFSTQKLTWGSAVGIPFKVGSWIGPDGTGVVAALDPGSYGGGVNEDLSQNTSWLARIQNTGKQSGAYVDYHYYGTGDRGGSPSPDAVRMAEVSVKGKGPVKVVSSRADEMFLALTPEQKARLPKYQGELLLTQHSAGSITSQAHMKRWNRKNELMADAAERASVAASLWAGAAYPADRLYTNWDLLLGSQMHDMLPGTSLPKAYEYCYNDELLALNGFSHIETDAVGAVASRLDTQAKGTALVVQNPLSIAREDVVEAWVPQTQAADILVRGPDGKYVYAQRVDDDPTRPFGTKPMQKIVFVAKVPANGFATYDVVQGVSFDEARRTPFSPGPEANYRPAPLGIRHPDAKYPYAMASGRTLENARFKVTINEAGNIASVYDKTGQKECLKAPAGFDFQYHNPSAFPAWNMDWEDAQKAPDAHIDGPATIRVVENGPVRATIEVTREAMGSKFVQRISLATGGAGDRVEVANKIDWSTKEHALKAAFPLTTANPKATYDLQVGAIERGNNDPKKYEVPQHQWFDLTQPDGKYGVAILNDSKFGSDKPTDDTVRLTLLYTPGVRSGYQDQAEQDFGKHDILYAIAPHAGTWQEGKVAWTAKRLNQPLRAFTVDSHPGALGKSASLLTASTDQVEVTAIKRAEDGNGIIVRLRELTGKPATNVVLKMPQRIVSVQAVDGQERPIGGGTIVNGTAIASVKGFSLSSYRILTASNRMAMPQPVSKALDLPLDLDVASTAKNDKDGAMDGAGRSYAAEMLPKTMTLDGVGFKLGSTADGAKNALQARGQTVAIPAGYDRVYVLSAATEDTRPTFKVGEKAIQAEVPSWTGYVGQWDLRLWDGPQPELSYGWPLGFTGVAPGYVKGAEVAWYASHDHLAGKGNGYYEYTYLFKQAFDVPRGATTMTLPNDPRVTVFAVSVAKATHDDAAPAAPLYDTLADHVPSGGPRIGTTALGPEEGVDVTVQPALYGDVTKVRVTTDGSTPTAASPAFTGAIYVGRTTVVKAAQVEADGTMGPVAEMRIVANDTTAPKVTGTALIRPLGVATLMFSEPVDRALAGQAGSYVATGAKVTAASVAGDGAERDAHAGWAGADGHCIRGDGDREGPGWQRGDDGRGQCDRGCATLHRAVCERVKVGALRCASAHKREGAVDDEPLGEGRQATAEPDAHRRVRASARRGGRDGAVLRQVRERHPILERAGGRDDDHAAGPRTLADAHRDVRRHDGAALQGRQVHRRRSCEAARRCGAGERVADRRLGREAAGGRRRS